MHILHIYQTSTDFVTYPNIGTHHYGYKKHIFNDRGDFLIIIMIDKLSKSKINNYNLKQIILIITCKYCLKNHKIDFKLRMIHKHKC